MADANTGATQRLVALLKEARQIIRASSSRSLAKDWDQRATYAIAAHRIESSANQRGRQ